MLVQIGFDPRPQPRLKTPPPAQAKNGLPGPGPRPISCPQCYYRFPRVRKPIYPYKPNIIFANELFLLKLGTHLRPKMGVVKDQCFRPK